MTVDPNHHHPGGDTDAVDALLNRMAQDAEPDDAGFSDAVLRALPPPATVGRRSSGMHWIHIGALAAVSALLVWLLPPVVDLLTAGGAGELTAGDAWEHLLAPAALVAWMSWWALQRPFAE